MAPPGMTTDPLSSATVLATDLDGTLLRSDGSIGERTQAELEAAAARGVRTIFVTGRPPRWMPAVVAATGHAATAICANGAVTVDLADETILSSRTFPPEVLAETISVVAELFGDLGDRVWFAVEQAVAGPISDAALHHEAGFSPLYPSAPIHRAELASVPGVVKLLARTEGDPADTAAVASVVTAALDESVTVTHGSRLQQLLEISPAGIDKASALAGMAARWRVGAESVAAVGDMPNDIPMIRWAGRGFAVASAHADLLVVADEIVPDPEHDGVADILARLAR